MSIDFFCDACKTTTNAQKFGLCDDPPPARTKAYIDTLDESKWIAIVENPNSIDVDFHAIDWCSCTETSVLNKGNKEMEKRCDAMLFYKQTLVFVELKDRDRQAAKWVPDAIEQVQVTMRNFKTFHSMELGNFLEKKVYLVNRSKPNFASSQIHKMQNFYQETGFVLRIEQKIQID